MTFSDNDPVINSNQLIVEGVNIPPNTDGVIISQGGGSALVEFTLDDGNKKRTNVPLFLLEPPDKKQDLAEFLGAKVVAALAQIESDETARQNDENAVDTDLQNVGAANNTELRNMVGRMLTREKKARNRESRALARQKVIIKRLSRLIT